MNKSGCVLFYTTHNSINECGFCKLKSYVNILCIHICKINFPKKCFYKLFLINLTEERCFNENVCKNLID